MHETPPCSNVSPLNDVGDRGLSEFPPCTLRQMTMRHQRRSELRIAQFENQTNRIAHSGNLGEPQLRQPARFECCERRATNTRCCREFHQCQTLDSPALSNEAAEACQIHGVYNAGRSLESPIYWTALARVLSASIRDSMGLRCGEVAERLIAPVLKTGVLARGPWVRIPPSPPDGAALETAQSPRTRGTVGSIASGVPVGIAVRGLRTARLVWRRRAGAGASGEEPVVRRKARELHGVLRAELLADGGFMVGDGLVREAELRTDALERLTSHQQAQHFESPGRQGFDV